ncbi:ATP-binding cassette domain-containing protein [Aquimonas sp.]|jgi:ABC-2 type transport system ATP-binding protein|uniref:ATP-binding cassette domain-containing protein n=1 Tax=Aquimonas sp. TaxID=1872588 RepID=UPI0037BECBE8
MNTIASALLSIESLALDLGGRPVLRDISLELARGEFIALVGPNGSGKSSLLRCIAGLHTLAGGRITVAGQRIDTQAMAARAALGCAVDPAALPGLLSGQECLSLFAHARGLGLIPPGTLALAEALRFTPWLARPVEEYSLGTRQKLGVLLGLLGEPPLLLLDEPLNGLDPPSALALKQHLVGLAARGDTAILLATHAIEMAERHVNRAVLLVEGQLRQQWSATQLMALRTDPQRSLETEMVAAM